MFFNGRFNGLVCAFTLLSFSTSSVFANYQPNLVNDIRVDIVSKGLVDDAIFITKVVKFIKKLKKIKDKSPKQIVKFASETIVDVEQYFNIRFDIKEGSKEVQRTLKKEGLSEILDQSSQVFKLLKKSVKKARKKVGLRHAYIDEIEDIYDEDDLYDEEFSFHRKKDNEKGKDNKPSMALTVSITAMLVGVFLCVIPIPVLQAHGADLFKWGLGGAACCIATEMDHKKEEEEEEEKKRSI